MAVTFKTRSPLGAEVIGADLEALLEDEGIPALVMEALEANGVLVFPGIGFDDAQQVTFAHRLGEISVRTGPKAYGRMGAFPEIYRVGFSDELDNALQVKGAFFWHIDGTTDAIPSKASLLTARSIATEGGDTQFVSTYEAHERLSDEERRQLAGLRVVHSLESAYRAFDPEPSDEVVERLRSVPSELHPLVWTHRSGRRSLVLGTTAERIEGMGLAEGRALLAELMEQATGPERILTHHWCVGDLVIWDNRGTMHRATRYAEDSGRMMHRVTLAGDEPIE
jgi:alpha-ketoglutarate-dependent taurine dioxygenase